VEQEDLAESLNAAPGAGTSAQAPAAGSPRGARRDAPAALRGCSAGTSASCPRPRLPLRPWATCPAASELQLLPPLCPPKILINCRGN